MMLEKTSTRRVIKRIKDDASSLYVQRDSMSIYSRCTDNLSKISKMFEFDRELFVSKVYEKALRGSLKDTVENIRQKQQRSDVRVSQEERDRDMIIQRDIKEHAAKMKREVNVLLLGECDCVQGFIKNMKIRHADGFTDDERRVYKEVVMKYMMRVMEGMVLVQKNGDTDLDNTAKMKAKLISQEIEAIQAGDEITTEGAGAVQGLWKDILKRDLKYQVYIPDSSP
jgi:guanine nucleotide-binding protein G(i) subunit alpha